MPSWSRGSLIQHSSHLVRAGYRQGLRRLQTTQDLNMPHQSRNIRTLVPLARKEERCRCLGVNSNANGPCSHRTSAKLWPISTMSMAPATPCQKVIRAACPKHAKRKLKRRCQTLTAQHLMERLLSTSAIQWTATSLKRLTLRALHPLYPRCRLSRRLTRTPS